VTPYPLDVLGAESQGMIGYMLQQALKNNLPVQPFSAASAFAWASLYTGPMYLVGLLKAGSAASWTFRADGTYFRRVVPSPQPKRIVESDAITALIQRRCASAAERAPRGGNRCRRP
jgi:carbamate kinase